MPRRLSTENTLFEEKKVDDWNPRQRQKGITSARQGMIKHPVSCGAREPVGMASPRNGQDSIACRVRRGSKIGSECAEDLRLVIQS